jgi:phosphatidylglycerol---prolipoprotein diacylglyceryl transferase
MLRYPEIDKVALHLGPVQIHWYGITYVIAFAAAWWLARRQAARPGSTWNVDNVDDLIFWAMVGVIVGGRIGYVLMYVLPFQFELLRADWLYPLKIWEGGMSFHGGFLGVIISLVLYARRYKRRVLDVLDFAAPLPAIGIFSVRIANFINNELWGGPTNWKWGFLVKDPVSGEVVGRHASQLYEAVGEGLMLFILLWWFSRKQRPMGAVVGLGMVWYALARMTLEFVRVPDSQIGYLLGGWFTMGHLLSLPMLLVGIALLLRAKMQPQPSGNVAVRV